MATISITTDFDVIPKYESLVSESLSGSSVYIRAKETLDELYKDNAISESQKAEVLTNIIGSAVNAITNASMGAAVQWAQAEKDFALRKLEAEIQLDILANQRDLAAAQVAQTENATRLAKVESRRMYGVATFDGSGNITSLDSSGKVWEDMELVKAQELKVDADKLLVDQKVIESQAAVHKIVADTYVNYGNYLYTAPTATGVGTVTKQHGTFKTLSDTQQDIAIEQAKGYVYNAWANALTGSASMLGTAIAAEYAEFGPGQPGGILLDNVLDAAANLKAASTTTDEAVPAP